MGFVALTSDDKPKRRTAFRTDLDLHAVGIERWENC